MNAPVRHPTVAPASRTRLPLAARVARARGLNPPGDVLSADLPSRWTGCRPAVRSVQRMVRRSLADCDLFPDFDRHMGHHQSEAERLHRAEQDPVPPLPASPIDRGIGIGAEPVGHLDGPGDDLPDGKSEGHLIAEPLCHHEQRSYRMGRFGRDGEPCPPAPGLPASAATWAAGDSVGMVGFWPATTKSARAPGASSRPARRSPAVGMRMVTCLYG